MLVTLIDKASVFNDVSDYYYMNGKAWRRIKVLKNSPSYFFEIGASKMLEFPLEE